MLLTVRHVLCGYNHQPVLREVSFDVPRGSICCLLGANGSGKTTLMRTLLGVIPLISGEILLEGQEIHQLSERQRARLIAWVPQAHDGIFAFTVMEMVMMGLTAGMSVFAVPGIREREIACQQLDTLGISHLAQRQWNTLSGGERQLVLIARALSQQPRLLLLDEPASSLDFGHQVRLLDTLIKLKESGMALVMSTHHPQHARAIADSVVCVAGGGISQGSVAEQLSRDRLATLYRVSPAQINHHLFGIQ